MSTTTPATLSNNSILLREDQEHVTTLTLNRPESGNSLSHALVNDLQKTFREIALDSNIRVVVLTATGRLFCTGHDLKESLNTKEAEEKRAANIACAAMLQSMLELPQPVIAKVRGIATAAGCELVATCDLAIASENSQFAPMAAGRNSSTPTTDMKFGISKVATSQIAPYTKSAKNKLKHTSYIAHHIILVGDQKSGSCRCEFTFQTVTRFSPDPE